jgi:hypothetical protein
MLERRRDPHHAILQISHLSRTSNVPYYRSPMDADWLKKMLILEDGVVG